MTATDNEMLYYALTGAVNEYCNKRIKRIRCIKQKLRVELERDGLLEEDEYYNIPELEDFFKGKIRDLENIKRVWRNIIYANVPK